jgi:hypothetical protein
VTGTTLSYRVVKITYADWSFPGYGPAVLLVQVSPAARPRAWKRHGERATSRPEPIPIPIPAATSLG